MNNVKIPAPINTLDDKQYKLTDFVEEFSDFVYESDKSRFGCSNEDKNLIRFIKNDILHFKNEVAICPHCRSSNNVKNGYSKRKLVLLGNGETETTIQKYKCKKCNKTFTTDMSALVFDNCNVTIPVIETIEKIYRNYGAGLHKIRQDLKENHNVEISHQTIENIIMFLKIDKEYENWTLSGHYLFDSLWVKIKGEWMYILALFDLGLNTIVSIELVDSEDTKTIYKFLNKSLANQKRYSIGTDLKHEYRDAVRKIGAKHHFCRFHVKQKINRDIKNYLKENNVLDEEKEIIKSMKQRIFDMLDSDDIKSAKEIRNEFFNFKKEKSSIIYKILWDLAISHFKNLTYHIEDKKIASTNNKIENSFQKIFPKHIKKTIRSINGVIQRFLMKLENWNLHNKLIKNQPSS